MSPADCSDNEAAVRPPPHPDSITKIQPLESPYFRAYANGIDVSSFKGISVFMSLLKAVTSSVLIVPCTATCPPRLAPVPLKYLRHYHLFAIGLTPTRIQVNRQLLSEISRLKIVQGTHCRVCVRGIFGRNDELPQSLWERNRYGRLVFLRP